jgi:hypothetical protein
MRGALGGFVDRLLGRDGTRWAGSVADLLYEGETVRRELAVGEDQVVVTSHRLLAFTPTRDGENYHQVDLPNVVDVRAGYDGERHLIGRALRTLLYGALLLAVGVFVDFGAFVPADAFSNTGATGRLGLGGVIGLVQQVLGLIARLDEIARLVGALVVLFAVFVLAVYLVTRDRAVVVRVAGDADDVVIPANEDRVNVDAAVADLERALFGTDPTEPDAGPTGRGADTAATTPDGDEHGSDANSGSGSGSGSSSGDLFG